MEPQNKLKIEFADEKKSAPDDCLWKIFFKYRQSGPNHVMLENVNMCTTRPITTTNKQNPVVKDIEKYFIYIT